MSESQYSSGFLSTERVAPDPVALWTSSAFIEEARAWVGAQLAPRGSRLTGEWEQPHARAWSSTIRFETTEGRVWFKVNGSGTAYEAALIALLGELRPGLAPEVIAHDDNRRWSLTRDGGPILRSIVAPDALWTYWERLLPRYAEAQLALAEHRPRLLSTGTPDLGPAQLPLEYRRLLDRARRKAHRGRRADPGASIRPRAPAAGLRQLVRRAGHIADARHPAAR